MLPQNHKISFNFFDAGGGDAVWIRYLGNDNKWHNILIDGGFGLAYKYCFGPLIREIVKEDECVDLWVISHIDRDHVGAVLGFIRDKKIQDKNTAVKQFWFNHSELVVKPGNGKLSVKDGIKFRTFLEKHGLLINEAITNDFSPVEIFGLKLTVLSPTPDLAANAAKLWQEEERSGKLGRSAEDTDHGEKIETLELKGFKEDADPVNGSSIALLTAFEGIAALLLADSHPSTVYDTLIKLGYSPENPLPVNFIQLAHHGSKANTSSQILGLVKSSDYVVTGNGITNRHPDKETLVRVLTKGTRSEKHLRFWFSSNTMELKKIFAVDKDPTGRFDFSCLFKGVNAPAMSLEYLPLAKDSNE